MKKALFKISGMHGGVTPTIFNNAAKLRRNMAPAEEIIWNKDQPPWI